MEILIISGGQTGVDIEGLMAAKEDRVLSILVDVFKEFKPLCQ